jgi:hypothetical protein
MQWSAVEKQIYMANPFMNNLTFQTPIRIVNDWSKTTKVATQCIDLVQTKSARITKEYKFSDYGYHYEIGNTGTVAHITNGSTHWYAVTGKLIESTMRFLPSMVSDLADLNPTFASINYMIGNGAEHQDHAAQKTGFNYFFNTSDSTTYVRNNELVESYRSIKDTSWILDIQQLHSISNTNERIWFNLRFGKPFAYCRDWFADHLTMVYE